MKSIEPIEQRLERIEALQALLLARTSTGAIIATASGTIDALGNVTINHKTPNISSITANIGANQLTLNFGAPIDTDGIYFAVCFVYDPTVGTSPFLPIAQTTLQTLFAGAYPAPGPWDFALIAIANS